MEEFYFLSMTPEQEILAERIIQLHKEEKDGFLNWAVLYAEQRDILFPNYTDDEQKGAQLDFIKSILTLEGLIEIVSENKDRSILTQKGSVFISFKDERKEIRKKEKEERSISWPQRHWLLIAIFVAFLSSIPTVIGMLNCPHSPTNKSIQSPKDTLMKKDTVLKQQHSP